MNPNELRLGNMVYWDNENGVPIRYLIVQISELRHYDNFKPIPITEGELIRFKFIKNKNDTRYWKRGSLKIKQTDKGFKFKYGESITYLKYIHQLQNLYFALNNNEL